MEYRDAVLPLAGESWAAVSTGPSGGMSLKLLLRIVPRHRKRLLIKGRCIKHGVGHDGFDDRPQPSGSQLELYSLFDDIVEGFVIKDKGLSVEFEEAGILLDNGILRLCEDISQCGAV